MKRFTESAELSEVELETASSRREERQNRTEVLSRREERQNRTEVSPRREDRRNRTETFSMRERG